MVKWKIGHVHGASRLEDGMRVPIHFARVVNNGESVPTGYIHVCATKAICTQITILLGVYDNYKAKINEIQRFLCSGMGLWCQSFDS